MYYVLEFPLWFRTLNLKLHTTFKSCTTLSISYRNKKIFIYYHLLLNKSQLILTFARRSPVCRDHNTYSSVYYAIVKLLISATEKQKLSNNSSNLCKTFTKHSTEFWRKDQLTEERGVWQRHCYLVTVPTFKLTKWWQPYMHNIRIEFQDWPKLLSHPPPKRRWLRLYFGPGCIWRICWRVHIVRYTVTEWMVTVSPHV